MVEADRYVSKRVLPAHHKKKFKLVSLSLQSHENEAICTLVYGQAGNFDWELLASVDFKQHGAAPPGHWHLNRTSGGGVLAHSHVSAIARTQTKGDPKRTEWGKGEVWHGTPESCPLWWLFIPRGMRYASMPKRIRALLDQFDISDSDQSSSED